MGPPARIDRGQRTTRLAGEAAASLVLAALLAGCGGAGREGAAGPLPSADADILVGALRHDHAPPPGDLRVRLAFGPEADLDLYVTDPMGEAVYFANPRAASGGRLDGDRRCGDAVPRIEEVTFPSPRPGRYRVGVDFPERCDSRAADAAFAVSVEHGARREERPGRASLRRFEPIVLEIDVP